MSDSPNGKLPLYKVGETVHPFINDALENPAKILDVTLHDDGIYYYGLDNGSPGKLPESQLQPVAKEKTKSKLKPNQRYLMGQKGDHEGHAQIVLIRYARRILYTKAFGWMWYTGTHWETSNAEAAVNQAIIETLKARRKAAVDDDKEALVGACKVNVNNVNGTREILKSFVTVDIEEFDSDPDSLNCQNGVLNLRTGDLVPHAPSQRFTYVLQVEYNAQADKTPWLNFLNSVLESEDIVRYLQRACGYSLTGHTWEEIMFYLYGPTRSGKGTFTEVFLKLLGWPLSTGADFETFTARRDGDTQNFDLAPLKPCRFVSASESNKYTSLNEAKLKQLTGGDRIRCAFKRRDHFSYKPQFKIWLSSNHKVNVDVDDDAAWARIRVINFPNSFLGIEDKTLKRKLTDPKALEGVLAWAVEGAKEWFNSEKGLITPQKVAETTVQHRDDLDYIHQFLIETYDDKTVEFVASSDMYFDYKGWCDTNGYKPKYQVQFTRALVAKGLESTRDKRAGKQVRGIKGIKEYVVMFSENGKTHLP